MIYELTNVHDLVYNLKCHAAVFFLHGILSINVYKYYGLTLGFVTLMSSTWNEPIALEESIDI